MSAGIVETQFAQRLASNEKSHRDKAVRKLKKWLSARSACKTNVMTKDELLYLWKGLFYCMWMSDKPLVQEELAAMLSDLINCFSNIDSALLFIDAYFETMQREWTGIDYLRIDKFMMLVRKFLAGCFKLVSKSKWDSNVVDGLLEVLSNNAISNGKVETGVGLQLHVADIYVEELAKAASEEVFGNDLTKFFIPYCDLLIKCSHAPLRKTVIDRVFKFAIRLSNDEESDDEEEASETKGGSENANENDVASDDDDSISSIDDENILYKGERQWRHRVRRSVREAQMLPFPKFDYQNIGDVLLEIAGKNKSISLKHRGEIYDVVKLFHEMAMGIFPLDTVAHSEGARLKSRDVEAAAKRLLEDDEEDARETEEWKETLRRLSKKRKSQDDVDSMDSSSEIEMDAFEDESLMKHKSSKKPDNSSNHVETSGEDSGLIVDKLLQRLLAKREQNTEKKKARKRKSKKLPKEVTTTQASENSCIEVTNGNESCCIVNGESTLIKRGKSAKVCDRQPQEIVLTAKAKKRKSKQMSKSIDVEDKNSSSPNSTTDKSESNGNEVIGNEPCISSGESPVVESCLHENKQPEIVLAVKGSEKRGSRRQNKKRKMNDSLKSVTQTFEQGDAGHEFKGEHIQPDSSGEAITDGIDIIIGNGVQSLQKDDSLKILSKPETCMVTDVTIDSPQTDTCEPPHDPGDVMEKSAPAKDRLISPCKDNQDSPSTVGKSSVEKSSDDHLTNKKMVSSSPEQTPVEINEATAPIGDTINEDHDKNNKLLRETKKLSKSAVADNKNSRCQTPRKLKETSVIATGGVSRIPIAKGGKKKGGNRYFDQFIPKVDEGDQLGKKKIPAPKTNEDFVKFDTFLKSPPVFFKTAVAKVSPKAKKRTISSTPDVNGGKIGLSKRVSFELKKNGSQDVKEYVDSVKNRPDLPFDAQNVPSQSALKLSSQKPPKSFLSLNVNQKKRTLAKDFFVFD